MALWRPFCLSNDRHLKIYIDCLILCLRVAGAYKNPTWLLPKSRIRFHYVDNYINFRFSQMAAILDFTHNEYLKYFQTTPLCRAYLKTLR